ncbi:helix-turn-helix domain-containing protein [Nonomuraea sp. NPDC050786]|uniref:helix-turn-helix domain-containing protein n=1 Tax=Nonomuraea sp. NPDC050786 TaxID=3154840 RepID=UPI0033FC4240
MKLRYNYRLYPDAGQRQMLAKTFGCARVVWNDALAARKAARKAGRPFIGMPRSSVWC